MSKYNARRTTIDGITFDSKAEARRYEELKLLQAGGTISGLTLQPSYELQPKFTDDKGVKHRAIVYIADFRYREQYEEVVEDVKGMQTAEFKIKHKLLLFRHPGLDFRIIS